MTQIVILDGFTTNPGDLSWELIETLGDLKVYDRTEDNQIIERAADADIVLTNKTRIDSDTIASLPDLKLICVMATGYDIVDIEAAKKAGVIVSNVVGYSTPSVVQHTYSLILELLNNTGIYSEEVKRGDWHSSIDFSYWHKPIYELRGKVLGIIGLGNIGQSVAKVGLAFGMKVITVKRSRKHSDIPGVEYMDFDYVLSESDILSLHCPLKSDNYHMIGRNELELMKNSALLINTARGGLVDFQSLVKALEADVIGGAGLDVLESEPPTEDIQFSDGINLIVTPHQAWASLESRKRLLEGLAENIRGYQTGYPKNVVS